MTPYEQGQIAFRNGLYTEDNPFQYGSSEYELWESGWLDSRIDDDYWSTRVEEESEWGSV